MLLHDVIMTSYYCQRYTECLVTTLCSSRTVHCTPCHARATVELLHQEMPNFLASNLWPPNSPDLSPVDYDIWAVMHHHVYHRQIHGVDELKRRLIDVWCGLEQSIFTRLLTSGEENIERVSMVNQFFFDRQCSFRSTKYLCKIPRRSKMFFPVQNYFSREIYAFNSS